MSSRTDTVNNKSGGWAGKRKTKREVKKMNWIDKMDLLKETIGAENAFEEICRAIGSIKAEEVLDYIINLYDLNENEEE